MSTRDGGKEIGMVLLMGARCRCGHEWLPRDKEEKPRVCPACKSPNWDRPKRWERPRESGRTLINRQGSG